LEREDVILTRRRGDAEIGAEKAEEKVNGKKSAETAE
jgi:hypothetical protein